jgi:bifunctional non-homologous end joining protein LigD
MPSAKTRYHRAMSARRARRVRSSNGRAEVAGIHITHPERLLYPESRLSKLDVARYYESIAEWMLPHVRGRPLTLVRCPTGVGGACFFMKHSKLWAPPALRRIDIREKTKIGQYLVADSTPGVVSLAQMDVLEIHTWNSRAESVEKPDRIVLDLDPGPLTTWADVVRGARLLRQVLGAAGLRSFVKTTGGKGLHVVVPLAPERDWSECYALSRAIAVAVTRSDPSRYTVALKKAGRERQILIDYLRNNRTNTSVAAYSTRATPNAPVSVPLAWDELDRATDPSRFTVKSVPARLRVDPWAQYFKVVQTIDDSMLAAFESVS